MTEIVYLLRLCSYSLSFLVAGLVLGGLALLPDIRAITGLPADAVNHAIEAELAFDEACPGQGAMVSNWAGELLAPAETPPAPVRPGDVAGAITGPLLHLRDVFWPIVRPWLVLIGMRGAALGAVMLASAPLALSVWLLGRRQSWIWFRRGTPATDAQRLAWVWLMGIGVTTAGMLVAVPLAMPMTPWLPMVVVLLIALLFPIRAATAARL